MPLWQASLLGIAAWIVLSFPVAVLMGRALGRASNHSQSWQRTKQARDAGAYGDCPRLPSAVIHFHHASEYAE
jgi:hypothetical protein